MLPADFINTLQYILYGWLVAALIISAYTDILQRRIPNLVTLPTIIIALAVHTLINGVDGLLFSLGGLVIGFAAIFLPYSMGGIGAGDVKLMGAVGAVLGFGNTVVSLLFIAVFGGVIALGLILYRGTFKETFSRIFLSFLYLGAYRDGTILKSVSDKPASEGMPFGAAIAGGVFSYFIYMISQNGALPVLVGL